MDNLGPREFLLIVTGILNLGVSVYALIVVGRSHAHSKFLKLSKYSFVVALALYAMLESNWITRGLYSTSTWMPILWNLMDMIWMLSSTVVFTVEMRNMATAAKRLMELADKLDSNK